jgi:hypothetical protein
MEKRWQKTRGVAVIALFCVGIEPRSRPDGRVAGLGDVGRRVDFASFRSRCWLRRQRRQGVVASGGGARVR